MKKLKLKQLKVSSFVTDLDDGKVNGGATPAAITAGILFYGAWITGQAYGHYHSDDGCCDNE